MKMKTKEHLAAIVSNGSVGLLLLWLAGAGCASQSTLPGALGVSVQDVSVPGLMGMLDIDVGELVDEIRNMDWSQASGAMPSVSHSGGIRGLQYTPGLCDPELTDWFGDEAVKLLEAGYRDIYVIADLALPDQTKVRPYLQAARTERELTPLGIRNALWLQQRFRLIVALGSFPFEDSARMAGLGRRPGLTESHPWLYGEEHLQNELDCIDHALSALDQDRLAFVLYVEPRVDRAREFCRREAEHIRAKGFTGLVLYNGIIGAALNQGQLDAWGFDVRGMRSINDMATWRTSDQWVRCNDGMFSFNEQTAPQYLPVMTRTPGPGGVIVWDALTVGYPSGQRTDPLPAYLTEHVEWSN